MAKISTDRQQGLMGNKPYKKLKMKLKINEIL